MGLRFTSFSTLVCRLLLMNDGARNALLNEKRTLWSASGFSSSVVRGENTASSIEENLSTRPPMTQRTYLPMNTSSCTNAPPSLRSSPFGASDTSNPLCRKLPPNVSALCVPMARESPASTSKVLVLNRSGRNAPVGPRDSRLVESAVRMLVKNATRRAPFWYLAAKYDRYEPRSMSKGPMPVWMMPSVPDTPPLNVSVALSASA